jgi:PKD repeat protein
VNLWLQKLVRRFLLLVVKVSALKKKSHFIFLLMFAVVFFNDLSFVMGASLSVATNKSTYYRGDLVTVDISGGTSNGAFSLWVVGPGGFWKWGHQDNFTASGDFEYSFRFPTYWSYGTYTIKVYDKDTDTPAEKSIVLAKKSSGGGGGGGVIIPSNKKPVARAGANQTTFVGHTLYFDGSKSSDSDGYIIDYFWFFGDGSSAGEGARVSHVYDEAGLYTVTLTVHDNGGGSGSDYMNVTVIEVPGPSLVGVDSMVESNQTDYVVDALSMANTTVMLNSTDLMTVTVLPYSENPHPEAELPLNSLPSVVDVAVSDPEAVSWPIYVERGYSNSDVAGLDEFRLALYYFKGGSWHRCRETGVYMERNVVWANMYADEVSGSPTLIGLIPRAAEFVLSDLSVVPSEVEPGDSVTVSVKVTNVGEEAGNYTVEFLVDGEVEATEAVQLGGGNYTVLSFVLSREEVGSYNVEVDGLSTALLVALPPMPAEFILKNLVVEPAEIEPGENVTVSVIVENIGEEAGSYNVTLTVNEEELSYEDVQLDGGGEIDVVFLLTAFDAGDYNVTVNGVTSYFTVFAPPIPAEFTYSNLVVDLVQVEPGEEVTVSVTVVNIGEEAGTIVVDLMLDGEVFESKPVTLSGGESEDVAFGVSSEEEGSHTLVVGERTGSFTVVAPPRPFPWIWVDFLIIVAVIAVVYFLRQRRII